jgi:hypothetical protein
MSNAADDQHGAAHGTSLLPRDLTAEQMLSAPVLVAIDALLIADLTDLEDEAFAAAIQS